MSRGGSLLAAVLCAAMVACSPGAEPTPDARAERASASPKPASPTPTPATRPTRKPSATPTPTPAPAPARRTPSATPELVPELAVALTSGPRRASSPTQVVRQIVAAERAIAKPSTEPDVLSAAGHLQQLAYRELGNRPRWDRAVFRDLPRDLRPVVRANVASRREFRDMHPSRPRDLATELPAWRIVRPAPPGELMAAYRAAQRRFGVHWSTLAAINLVETGMGRIRGTSSAGAQGPMQFIPTTWDMYGRGDINSPRDAIMAAGRFLKANGHDNGRGRAKALFRYNNSNNYVRGVSHLADVMKQRPRAFHGYYHWQIYYITRRGDVLLPEGYVAKRPVPVKTWLARNG